MPSASEHGNRSECKGKTEQQLLYQRGSKRAQFVKYNHGIESTGKKKSVQTKLSPFQLNIMSVLHLCHLFNVLRGCIQCSTHLVLPQLYCLPLLSFPYFLFVPRNQFSLFQLLLNYLVQACPLNALLFLCECLYITYIMYSLCILCVLCVYYVCKRVYKSIHVNISVGMDPAFTIRISIHNNCRLPG